MSEKIEYKIDRTGWPSGEWDSESDRTEFVHAGFACLLVRNSLGAWCGYVGVPEAHPAFGKDYEDVKVEVHGGLTYVNLCQEGGPICHVPQPGMPEKVWWLGFDTLHYLDAAPGMLRAAMTLGVDGGGTYRTMEWTREETKRLAEQLAD